MAWLPSRLLIPFLCLLSALTLAIEQHSEHPEAIVNSTGTGSLVVFNPKNGGAVRFCDPLYIQWQAKSDITLSIYLRNIAYGTPLNGSDYHPIDSGVLSSGFYNWSSIGQPLRPGKSYEIVLLEEGTKNYSKSGIFLFVCAGCCNNVNERQCWANSIGTVADGRFPYTPPNATTNGIVSNATQPTPTSGQGVNGFLISSIANIQGGAASRSLDLVQATALKNLSGAATPTCKPVYSSWNYSYKYENITARVSRLTGVPARDGYNASAEELALCRDVPNAGSLQYIPSLSLRETEEGECYQIEMFTEKLSLNLTNFGITREGDCNVPRCFGRYVYDSNKSSTNLSSRDVFESIGKWKSIQLMYVQNDDKEKANSWQPVFGRYGTAASRCGGDDFKWAPSFPDSNHSAMFGKTSGASIPLQADINYDFDLSKHDSDVTYDKCQIVDMDGAPQPGRVRCNSFAIARFYKDP